MILLNYNYSLNCSTPRVSLMPHRYNCLKKYAYIVIQSRDFAQDKYALLVRLYAVLDKTISQLALALLLVPSADKDQFTFNILKNVIESSRIPKSLRLDHLFDFLLLVHKYNLGYVPLEQAKSQAQILRLQVLEHLVDPDSGSLAELVTKTFTKLIKLYRIFQKLGITKEFREASTIIQKHTQLPIDKLVKPSIILLPQDVISIILL